MKESLIESKTVLRCIRGIDEFSNSFSFSRQMIQFNLLLFLFSDAMRNESARISTVTIEIRCWFCANFSFFFRSVIFLFYMFHILRNIIYLEKYKAIFFLFFFCKIWRFFLYSSLYIKFYKIISLCMAIIWWFLLMNE